jgi:hypothetical protein
LSTVPSSEAISYGTSINRCWCHICSIHLSTENKTSVVISEPNAVTFTWNNGDWNVLNRSCRKLSLFSDIQTGLAFSKWPPIGMKLCIEVSRILIFKIRLVLEGSNIFRFMVILPNMQCRLDKRMDENFINLLNSLKEPRFVPSKCALNLGSKLLERLFS